MAMNHYLQKVISLIFIFTPQKCENKFAAAIKNHNRSRLVIQFAVRESDEICVTAVAESFTFDTVQRYQFSDI
jgi:hypothetical protein